MEHSISAYELEQATRDAQAYAFRPNFKVAHSAGSYASWYRQVIAINAQRKQQAVLRAELASSIRCAIDATRELSHIRNA